MNEQQWKQYYDDYGEALHFYKDEGEKEIIIPEYITHVDSGLFFKFNELEKVTLKGVKQLNTKTFEKCEKLKTIILEYQNIKVSKNAVKDCSPNLKVVFKGKKEDAVIHKYSFPEGTEIIWDNSETKEAAVAIESDLSEFIIEEKKLLKYVGNNMVITIPDTVETIGSYSFDYSFGSKLNQLIIPDNVKEISTKAFRNCTGLQKVVIGSGVTLIGDKAFSGYTPAFSVIIKARKENVKLYKHSFPDGTNITWEGMDEEKEEKLSSEYQMTLKKAKQHLKLSEKSDGYAINGFGIYQGKKFVKYEIYDYFEDSGREKLKPVIERIVSIPDYIDGMKVSSVSTKAINDNAVVLCSEDVFSKLTKETKVSTALAYLEDISLFKSDEVNKIEEFLKKNADAVIARMNNDISAESFIRFITLTKLKKEQKDALLEKLQDRADLKAIMLDLNKEKPETELVLMTDKSLSATEIKKNWSVQTKKNTDGETRCYLTHYKGTEKKVIVPDTIGKNLVYELRRGTAGSVFSDNLNVESITIPNTIPTVSAYYMIRNCQNLREVVLGDNVTALGPEFISYCYDVHLYVTDKLADITGCYGHEEAFAYSNNIIIHAPKGSYAIEYAKENNMRFVEE